MFRDFFGGIFSVEGGVVGGGGESRDNRVYG